MNDNRINRQKLDSWTYRLQRNDSDTPDPYQVRKSHVTRTSSELTSDSQTGNKLPNTGTGANNFLEMFESEVRRHWGI